MIKYEKSLRRILNNLVCHTVRHLYHVCVARFHRQGQCLTQKRQKQETNGMKEQLFDSDIGCVVFELLKERKNHLHKRCGERKRKRAINVEWLRSSFYKIDKVSMKRMEETFWDQATDQWSAQLKCLIQFGSWFINWKFSQLHHASSSTQSRSLEMLLNDNFVPQVLAQWRGFCCDLILVSANENSLTFIHSDNTWGHFIVRIGWLLSAAIVLISCLQFVSNRD
jgi:hypothetical protein